MCIRDRREIGIEQPRDSLRSQFFGQRGEVAHIAEQDRKVAPFGAQVKRLRMVDHRAHDLVRNVGPELAANRPPSRLDCHRVRHRNRHVARDDRECRLGRVEPETGRNERPDGDRELQPEQRQRKQGTPADRAQTRDDGDDQ